MFNAQKMRNRGKISKWTVMRDIMKIKQMIRWFAKDGVDNYKVYRSSPQYRTKDFWADYFIKKGFSVQKGMWRTEECVIISWSNK